MVARNIAEPLSSKEKRPVVMQAVPKDIMEVMLTLGAVLNNFNIVGSPIRNYIKKLPLRKGENKFGTRLLVNGEELFFLHDDIERLEKVNNGKDVLDYGRIGLERIKEHFSK